MHGLLNLWAGLRRILLRNSMPVSQLTTTRTSMKEENGNNHVRLDKACIYLYLKCLQIARGLTALQMSVCYAHSTKHLERAALRMLQCCD